MPPFQAERPEKKQLFRPNGGLEHRKPFCEEGEDFPVAPDRKRKAPVKPFGNEESSEEDHPRDNPSAAAAAVCSCSLGWDTLAAFAKSIAWNRQAIEYKNERTGKRPYDNSKRSMAAKQKKPNTNFAENGCDSERIGNLLTSDCECALDQEHSGITYV